MAIKFSGGQFLSVKEPKGLNFSKSLTLEAIFTLTDEGNNPTIFCRPIAERWECPFLVYRIGFFEDTGRAMFQFLVDGENKPTSIVAPYPIPLYKFSHIAGTYDGNVGRLYVDGQEVAIKEQAGTLAQSKQPVCIGVRSETDEGDFLIGSLYELRAMCRVRTAEEIFYWKDKPMPPLQSGEVWNLKEPRPASIDECVGLWSAW